MLASRLLIVAAMLTITTLSTAWANARVPNPADPHPPRPVATDGTPLPPAPWAVEAEAEDLSHHLGDR